MALSRRSTEHTQRVKEIFKAARRGIQSDETLSLTIARLNQLDRESNRKPLWQYLDEKYNKEKYESSPGGDEARGDEDEDEDEDDEEEEDSDEDEDSDDASINTVSTITP